MKNIAFTIGTLVNKPDLYEKMLSSFKEKGFGDDCEYIKIDNSGSRQVDAYAGLNSILNQARAPFIILCHQDVVLLNDGRPELEARLRELSEIDPYWAVAGNAGASSPFKMHMRLTWNDDEDLTCGGPCPMRVYTLDENFIVVRAESRVSFSRDLSGFHMYGPDICIVADVLGWNSYVIDFHLAHLGEGRMDEIFFQSTRQFRAKWSRALRGRHLSTTCVHVILEDNNSLLKKLYLFFMKSYFKIFTLFNIIRINIFEK